MRQKKIKTIALYSLLISFFTFVLSAEAFAGAVSLSAVPTTQTVTVGQTATYTIKINRDSYTDKVTLSATGLPSGVTATFTPNTTTATSSTLKLQTQTTTPVGTFNINVKGAANGVTIAPIIVKLITQPVPSISLTVNPSEQFIVAGQSTFYDVAVNRINYDGKLTFSAQNLPAGVSVVFEPESTYGNSTRMYLYSNGLPFLSNDFGMYVKAENPYEQFQNLTFIQLHVNTGIGWAAQFAAPNNQTMNPDFATDITYDSAGNVYVVGYTYNIGTMDYDSWVAKYNSTGNQTWLRVITSLVEDMATDVFVDAAGNVYAAGSALMNGHDIFVVKIDSGATQAPVVASLSTPNEEGQSGMQFGVDSSGNTILTAVTRVVSTNTGRRDFANEPAKTVNYDVTRYVFTGNLNHTDTTLVTNASGNPKDLAVSTGDAVYVLSEDLSQIGPDGFICITSQVQKFNAPNNQLYFTQNIVTNTANAYYAARLKVDDDGIVFAVGNKYRREIDFKLYLSNPWMVKLSTTGAIAWQQQFMPNAMIPTEVRSLEITAAHNGDILLSGATWGSLRGTNPNAGPPPSSSTPNPPSRTDAWFARFSGANAAQTHLSQFNVNDHDGFNALKRRTDGTLFFAGYTLNFKNMNFGQQDALVLQCRSLFCGFLQ